MPLPLSAKQRAVLSKLEPQLRNACRSGRVEEAERIIKILQAEFLHDRGNFRILRAKNWYFEAMLNAGKTGEAQRGFEAILARASEGTRIHLEASALLAVCYLRDRRYDDAKIKLRYIISNISNIKSNSRRQQFEKRLVQRVEDECILSQLFESNPTKLDQAQVHALSIEWVRKSEDEILNMIGAALPGNTQMLLHDVVGYSIGLMPAADQKLLPAPAPKVSDGVIGKKALTALKRIGWGTFCDEDSGVFKLWSRGIPRVFNEGYFAAAAVTSLAEWKIGMPQLAAGLAATAMRYSCKEFCERFRPEGLMIPLNEKG